MDQHNTTALFELEVELPNADLADRSSRLVGFDARYDRLGRALRLLVDADGVAQWSRRFYREQVPLAKAVADRYPLAIFYGDVGSGKTETAEASAARLAKEMGREGRLFKLSTRVRGSGHVGNMSTLISQAFDIVEKEAGKRRLAFLIIDEGDSLAASRGQTQSHHEDKVGVNTLIQRIDGVRHYAGRVAVILCTNRIDAIDSAILRRAGVVERFDRPSERERLELFSMDLAGLGFDPGELHDFARRTGAGAKGTPPYTFSDLRTRVLPEALARAYPDRRVEVADVLAAIKEIEPSAIMSDGQPRRKH
jgi:SpoVK/Ycf46/Vps4 family AAA+-type ATPase